MELAQRTDAEILAVVEPIMDNLMDASTAIDYPRHVRDFTERAKSRLSEDGLRAICAVPADAGVLRPARAGRDLPAAGFGRGRMAAVVHGHPG